VLLLGDLNLSVRDAIGAEQHLVVALHHPRSAPAVKFFLIPSDEVQGGPLDLVEIFQGLPSLLLKLCHHVVQLIHGGGDPG